jgi:hypothetical protein
MALSDPAADPADADGPENGAAHGAAARGTAPGGAGPRAAEPPAADSGDAAASVESRRRFLVKTYAPPVLIAIGIGIICLMNHFHGVDWGDDFALYMRQAKALNIGNVGEVIRDNRYTVDNSGWHTFSPYLYPWGWPLLVAPLYALVGQNFEAVKVLEVVALCGFLVFFYDLVRRRAGAFPAALMTLLIGLSPSYVGATDTVLSDLPYLGVVGLTLWWIDRCRRQGILGCRRRQLVIIGLLVAFAFNIRREGFTLLIPVAALQFAELAATVRRTRSVRVLRNARWKEVLLPFGTFASAAVAFQLLLPTTFLPKIPGAGLKNARPNISYYRNILAENVGLKASGYPMRVFHSHMLAERLLVLLAVLAVIGLVARLIGGLTEDIPLAAYLCAASLIMLTSPYQEGRYLFSITPFLVYFAYQALPALAQLSGLRRPNHVLLAAALPMIALAGLVNLNARATKQSTDYHRTYKFTVNGPNKPLSQDMFAAVERYTRGDDVILFFRARAMTLFTDRVALQGTDLDQMLPRVDWYVMEKGSTYSQTPLSDTEGAARGLTKVWENDDWVIWRVPRRAP